MSPALPLPSPHQALPDSGNGGNLSWSPHLSHVGSVLSLYSISEDSQTSYSLNFTLCPLGVPRSAIDGLSTKFLLDLCKQKSSRSSKHKSNLNFKNRESWPLNQFPEWSQFTDSEPLERRGGWVPLRKHPATLPKMYAINLPPSLPQKDLQPLSG